MMGEIKLWNTPVYRFRVPKDKEIEESLELKEIVIDVTGSAPGFKEPSGNLKNILKEIFNSDSFEKVDTVLEFGAAKLKNIPFILEEGKGVCAVEFKELTKKDFTKKNLEKCKRYGPKFQKLVFPNPFITDDRKFDLALLLNVPPIMPVFAERMFVLQLLYEKVKKGKYLLWVAQKEGSYKEIRESGKNVCGDGIWMGKGRYFKTFYKYHKVDEVDEMMALCGFELVKRFSGGDDARLYKKIDYNIFSGLITPEKIRRFIPLDKTIEDPKNTKPKTVKRNSKINPVLPNPKELSMESLYIEKIKSIDVGPDDAELYHRLMSYAISRIFRGSLRNMQIKETVGDRIKIIDTVFTNCAEKGFFKNIQNKKSDCLHPMIEVKNTKKDPANPEIDQLNGRLSKVRGNFGILICREVKDEKAVNKRCQTHLPGRLILFLSDADVIELLEYYRDGGYEDIDDFMDRKLKDLLFR